MLHMNFIFRLPFAILGAVGLLTLATDVIHFQKHIASWLALWESASSVVWNAVWHLLSIPGQIPDGLVTYLTLTVIFGAAFARSLIANDINMNPFLPKRKFIWVCVIFFPLAIILTHFSYFTYHNGSKIVRVYWETAFAMIAILILNFALEFITS